MFSSRLMILTVTAGMRAAPIYTGQKQNVLNTLLGLSGAGQNAATNLGTTGTQLAGNVGQAQVGIGNSPIRAARIGPVGDHRGE
jgi:hypothetical protein